MSEQTVPDIYGWIEAVRERNRKEYEAVSKEKIDRTIARAEAYLASLNLGAGGDGDD